MRFLTTKLFLRISNSTLYSHMKHKKMPEFKILRHLFIKIYSWRYFTKIPPSDTPVQLHKTARNMHYNYSYL